MNLATASLPRATEVPSINLVAFYQLGDRSELPVDKNSFQLLRPALFANYHDLSRLRYDFPLILVNDNQGQEWASSLADTIDASLQKVAPRGIKGEELRRQVLNQEQEIRDLVSQGLNGSMSSLWEEARLKLQLAVSETMRSTLDENLGKAHAELDFDGEIIDCDAELPRRLFTHAWAQSQQVKSMQLRSRIDYLMQKLSDILRIDYLRSSEARDPGHLERSVGTGNKVDFDFQAMARILKSAPVGEPLSEKRVLRIREAIAVFQSQRFVTTAGGNDSFSFAFENCEPALEAFRERLSEMAMLVKAISIAELEIENRYDESQHDSFYRRFDQNQLGPEELAQFPSYLVVLEDEVDAADQHAVIYILRSGLPFKIIVQTENILGELSTVQGQLMFGTQGQQLARMALGLNNVFVLQSASSSLYPLRDHIMQGLACDLPALFSVYSPGKANQSGYLAAAAATESRAFPSFVFNPVSGEDLASRFHLVGNPRVGQDWPRHQLKYEDSELNGYREETAFTLLDFIATDSRFAEHFACIEPAYWSSNMLPVDAFLELDPNSRKDKVPYVLLIDEDDVIHRAVCNIRLIDAAKRCRDLWRNLQELGGINNSHALKALALEKQSISIASVSSTVAATAATSTSTSDTSDETVNTGSQQTPAAIEATADMAPEQDPGISPDAPWIETIRCTSCNECTELNDRMFAYDENKRAYIANPEAGSYRELVEAAENCQVSIIHPGKPRNLDEPGLEELIIRAEPFCT
ncbi:ferredoxin [Photobacterium sagamiensis]|uniref:ferredoxin n=1 Tax=Photobacterium sagamiensis TaxID=2910241 RepID=UPI003D0B2986